MVFGDRDSQRIIVEITPVGEKLVQGPRINHGTGQYMRADFAAFFQDTDRNVLAGFFGKLLQSDRSRKPCWPAADNHDVIWHGFPFGHSNILLQLAVLGSYRRGQQPICQIVTARRLTKPSTFDSMASQ